MNDDKIWVNGAFFKKKMFNNGGHIHTMWSPNVDELCQWLQANKKHDGSIAINISGSKEPRIDASGNEKLNASLDTWQSQTPQQAPVPAIGQAGYNPQPVAQTQAPQPVAQPGYQAPAQPVAQPVYQAPANTAPVTQSQPPQTQPVQQPGVAPQQKQMFDPQTGQPIIDTDIPF